ncbi:hypothetical protein WA026_009166 [Henosepilachna vigintioctopunctata]|uniref:C2H2-type domain-containing protein n=1 Tax=Henosepilachna vigintioctopunctata TaxID=420089 RepID=A0AAW1UP32_9CUCU
MNNTGSLVESYDPVICRICVNETVFVTRISDVLIEHESEKIPVTDVLKTFSSLQNVVENPMFYICCKCTDNATDLYRFKIVCENSTAKFEKYKNITKIENLENITIANDPEIKIEQSLIKVEAEECSDDDIPLINFTNEDYPNDSERCKFNKNERKYIIGKSVKVRKKKDKNKCERMKLDSEEGLNEEIITCKFCNKIFKNKYVLIAHQKRHENKGKFICNECGKGFDSKGCLSRHVRVHTGEKKFQCEECHRCFPSANNLRLHSRRHNGIKPYLCTQCGKSFSHPTGLSYHLRTHTRERPYTCEICGKSFLIQCHLDRHKKIHTGERPFGCSQCDRGFIKKIDLQRHEAIHTGERPHICKICNKAFLRILHLNYHMMVHTSERPHRCKYCGKGFIRRYYLTDHVKKHHFEDKELDSDDVQVK